MNGSGEPHGVIRFTGAVSSITWTSLTKEFWNGFTVGTYGLASPPSPVSGVPEPSTVLLLGTALFSLAAWRRKS
ncbi:PEP-CTERM sorting domain-containing protein [Nitrospira sp. Nam74]